ncbi:chromosomal replication initiator protein DnaA [Prevotella intermedia]|jgi:chromosomal replication initiator protein dnaA|uniref:Chromosomal replication initiator protein DnaA n=2 Tax=Prevotella intermedia TaxID=28131 RepID=A0A0H5B3N7_PREIN|nr:chromosomal replication initiator protein DnaA [Prevotella intermedia]AFJ09028.1 chromosomal replication initiator protein DnaA [Prevotella intermedia 17]APW31887.1 chromosomal replication initiator protein DnaA [Prevotella intermedia ATCC 25611 = DSM 20706]APW34726.1 chromosomal replication initiator protein DnaA [Prevotella intermedia]ATV28610.1 chromosomal replication initiator protein DnaA [Prevotella intermedia]ATV32450.1 chromosomal replication initiator protein DnaA [Prevotella inter
MKVQPNALWEQCLQLIRDNVTEQQFTTWFKPITFEAFDAATNILLVQVPSPFVYEYLEENYVDLLSKVLTRIYGKGVQLKYRIVTDKAHNLTQDIQSETVDNVETQLPTNRANQSPTPLDVALQEIDPQLDLHKSFSNYIEGDSNKLPRSIGLSIAEHPNTTQFNPMFIYGPSGCGKTHLINAIGLRIKQLYPQKRVLYISARLFQVQYTNSVLNNTTNDFINFYQTIDVLIVDDIQEWMTATKTQDTFFHIFNHLFKNGKRIILASDRPPVELKGMNERLLTRFACGLIAELEKPNVQLCVDILNSKIKRDGLNIPDDVVQFIAQTANGSVRDLQGVINSLLAYSVVYNSNIDMRLAERVIKRSVKIDDEPLTLDEIIDKVCSHFNVTVNAVNSRSRKQEIVLARQVSMYLAQKHTKMPASRIGKLVGGRDHSTVLHSCSQIEKRLQVDKGFIAELSTIENSFKLKS